MIGVDGMTWQVPCAIVRTAEVMPSDVSGYLLDKTYLNDVIATYMQYEVTMAVPPEMVDEYNELYEVLTQPVSGHQFVLPYGSDTIETEARVENVRDVYVLIGGRQYWKGVEFTVISNRPIKEGSLEEAMAGNEA